MHLATTIDGGRETAVLVDRVRGVIPAAALVLRGRTPTPHNGEGPVGLAPWADDDLLSLIRSGKIPDLVKAAQNTADHAFRPREHVRFTAPYRHPRLIWGIGLNYMNHAADLSESVPEEPASFIKGDHTIIGPGDSIPIPPQSERTTSEAEMGLVIGSYCRDVSEEAALDHVLGVVPVLDQTAEDILQRNPRYLTRSKNFPGFFSFGPEIVPLDEVGNLADVAVSTVVNGTESRTNTVSHMRFSPAYLVSFHSKVMPLQPGDILSPGTPGAIHVRPGDIVECRIPGVGTLHNTVVQG